MNTGNFGYKRKQENNKKSTAIVPSVSTRKQKTSMKSGFLFFVHEFCMNFNVKKRVTINKHCHSS